MITLEFRRGIGAPAVIWLRRLGKCKVIYVSTSEFKPLPRFSGAINNANWIRDRELGHFCMPKIPFRAFAS